MSVIRTLAMAAAIATLAAGCSTAPTEPVPETVVTMEVGPRTAPCVALIPRECLVVRWAGETEWGLFYSHIEGFSWEPGFTYKLIVALHPIANPPQDSSSVEYSLLHVISKVPVSQ